MAAKKKVEAPQPALPVDEDGFLCLTGDRLWKWRALDAELRAGLVELDSVKRQIAAEVAKNPELGGLLSKQGELMGAISMSRSELTVVQGEIEKQFNVSLKECAFDDKTGRLYNLKEDGERGEPMKTRAKRSKR